MAAERDDTQPARPDESTEPSVTRVTVTPATTPTAPTTPSGRNGDLPAEAGRRVPSSAVDEALSDSALGRLLLRGGDVFRDYGNWIVVGLVAVAVLAWVWRLSRQSSQQADVNARQGLMAMSDGVRAAENLRLVAPRVQTEVVADELVQLEREMSDAAGLTRDADSGVRAHALRLRGDYYWALATLPPALPATRPGEFTPPRASSEYLADAAAAYETLLRDFADQTNDVQAARFGLAAIAEEKGDFDAARGHYDALLAMANLPPTQKSVAEARRALLSRLSPQSRLAPPTTRPEEDPSLDDPNAALQRAIEQLQRDLAAQAATQPSGDPAAQPAGDPAAQPAGDAPLDPTAPATQPAAVGP